MGHSRAEKAQSRERILSLAGQTIRARGIDAISIGELMKEAGLTHGAFYVHFESRDALIAAALERALLDGEAAAAAGNRSGGKRTVKSIVNGYLSRTHRDDPAAGCAVSALSGDVARGGKLTRAIMMGKLERYFEAMAETASADDPDSAEEFAMAAWSTMIGAITLSRVFAGDERADRILLAARKAIMTLDETTAERSSAEIVNGRSSS